MGKVTGNWLTGAHSGRACRHEDVYTKINKKTGACYSVKLCNPNTNRTEAQVKTVNAFGMVSKAISAWINEQKAMAVPSADYSKVLKMYKRQTRYSSLRGMMLAKGMYKLENDEVVVDVNANTNFKSVSGTVQLPDGGSSSGGSANTPAAKYKLLLNASPAAGGSVEGAGEYAAGSSATIKAVANAGYTFSKWSDNDTNAQRTLQMTQNRSLIAYFVTEGSDSGSSGGGGGEQIGGGVD